MPERGQREKLPNRHPTTGLQAKVGSERVYIHTGTTTDGRLLEVFLRVAKQGDTLRAMFDALGFAVSTALQYGVPLEVFVDRYTFSKFEPGGVVQGHDRVKMASSILDYVFRELGITHLGMEELAHVGGDE